MGSILNNLEGHCRLVDLFWMHETLVSFLGHLLTGACSEGVCKIFDSLLMQETLFLLE